MLDHGLLQNHISSFQAPDAFSLKLKFTPAFQHIHHLKIALVNVPLLHIILNLLAARPDHMRHKITFRARLNANIAILKYLAQTRRPFRVCRYAVYKVPVIGVLELRHLGVSLCFVVLNNPAGVAGPIANLITLPCQPSNRIIRPQRTA